MSIRFAATAVALGCAFSGAARAAVTVYTDQAAFNAAVSSATTQATTYDFPSPGLNRDYGLGGALTQNGITFRAGASTYLFNLTPSIGATYGKDFLSFQRLSQAPATTGTISGIGTAIGLTFGTYINNPIMPVTFTGAGFSKSLFVPISPGTSFFGVVSDTAIGSLDFSTRETPFDLVTFTLPTTVVVTPPDPPAPAVPEPATWALMIAGFGMIGAALRRRRGASPQAA